MRYTSYYNLPQYEANDKTTWLTIFNQAMLDIDTGIHGAKAAADSADATATAAQSAASQASSDVTALTNSLNTVIGNINTINSLIGNGTPTTTDHTLIGAINELHADQGDLSNLQTTDKSSLVAAINEAAQSGGQTPTASNVSYNNTSSGLSANNVQSAIDELATAIPSATGYHIFTTTITNESSTAWGNMFAKFASVDISSLGLQSAPTKISASFVATGTARGLTLIGDVTTSAVEVGIVTNAAVSGQLNGTVMVIIYD